MSVAQARRDEIHVPSLEFDEEMLEILRDKADLELDEELLHRIVRPMLDTVRQLIRENPEAAETGISITINVKGNAPMAEYLGTAEVAEMFGMSQQQVRRWCEEGKIPAQRTPGGTWRIHTSQFDGVGILAPKAKRNRRDVKKIAGAWHGNDELREAFEEGRE